MSKKKMRPADGADEVSGKTVIRVRRGALRRFDLLKQKSPGLPVEITWDRRLGDRRGAQSGDGAPPVERRGTDRRQAPPFTWDMADFVVVGDRSGVAAGEPAAEPESEPAATPRRRSQRRGETR